MGTVTIAIQCALEKEARGIVEALEGVRHAEEYGVATAAGTYRGLDVVVGIGGMGTVSAGAAAQLLIARHRPQALLFTGIAGGLNPLLGVGDIVVGDGLRYLETNTAIIAECPPYLSSFASDVRLADMADSILSGRGWTRVASVGEGTCEDGAADDSVSPRNGARKSGRYVRGIIATSDQFNTDPDVLHDIIESEHADCEEMEGVAVAHVSAKCGVPFLAVRAISNRCGESYASLDDHAHDLVEAADAAASITLGVLGMISDEVAAARVGD